LKSTGVERWQLRPKSLFNIESNFNYGKFDILPFKSNAIFIINEKKISIYGIGLYTGVFQDKEETVTAYDKQTYFDETINIIVYQVDSKKILIEKHNSTHKYKQNSAVSVDQILFEKLEFSGDIAIWVKFDNKKPRTVISESKPANFTLWATRIDGVLETTQVNCLAYLLTSTEFNKN
jgi:hypothetical protein